MKISPLLLALYGYDVLCYCQHKQSQGMYIVSMLSYLHTYISGAPEILLCHQFRLALVSSLSGIHTLDNIKFSMLWSVCTLYLYALGNDVVRKIDFQICSSGICSAMNC